MQPSRTLFIVLTVVIFFCTSALSVDDYDEVERGDAFVDKLLREMIQEQGHDYDPYYMEDSVVGFHRKIGFVNVSGEAKLHDGYITGLRSLNRAEHCSLKEEGDKLNVRADMGAGVLDFHYSGSVKFMNWGPTVTIHGELAYVEVEMKFCVDAKTGKNGKLLEFNIDDMRGMKVWITGLGPLNWAVNPIISGVTSLFKGYVRRFMRNKVESHIAERLPKYQFPVEGVDINTEAPETEAPETEAPETEAPETEAPKTEAPKTEAPETEAPETEAPETEAPETETPGTEAPETEAPETESPETEAPETEAPETEVPETEAPEPEALRYY